MSKHYEKTLDDYLHDYFILGSYSNIVYQDWYYIEWLKKKFGEDEVYQAIERWKEKLGIKEYADYDRVGIGGLKQLNLVEY